MAVAMLVLATSALMGCHSPSQYISPRVTGRVLDAENRQPIKGAEVFRPQSGQVKDGDDVIGKGGQFRRPGRGARTREDGTFALDSQRDFSLFRTLTWYSVDVSFKHAGYVTFSTNYTLANSTNSASGEPVVNAGDILLKPIPK